MRIRCEDRTVDEAATDNAEGDDEDAAAAAAAAAFVADGDDSDGDGGADSLSCAGSVSDVENARRCKYACIHLALVAVVDVEGSAPRDTASAAVNGAGRNDDDANNVGSRCTASRGGRDRTPNSRSMPPEMWRA